MRSPIASGEKAIETTVFSFSLAPSPSLPIAIFARAEMIFAGLSVANEHLNWSRLGAIPDGAVLR